MSNRGSASRNRSLSPFIITLFSAIFIAGCACDVEEPDNNGTNGNGENGSDNGGGDNGEDGPWTCPTVSCECSFGEREPCYSGPENTLGIGRCRAGSRSCLLDGSWGPCWGEVIPLAHDLCGGEDNTCNGVTDDGCPCVEGASRPCYGGPVGTEEVGECRGGQQRCLGGVWGECEGQVLPRQERCDGLDNDCDGVVDNGCAVDCRNLPDELISGCHLDPAMDPRCCCILDPQACESCIERYNQPCYTGPGGTSGVGQCKGGLRDCIDGQWTECIGQILPAPEEICGDGMDNTCSGLVDDGCPPAECVPGPELCDGFDHTCTGKPREGCTCVAGVVADCYLGPAHTLGVGACAAGTQECIAIGDTSRWGPCIGSVTPAPERCDTIDHSCDGNPTPEWCCMPDPSCVDPLTGRETCCNGQDSNCNGIVDDGLLNACGLCPDEPCFIERFPSDDPVEGGWDCTDCLLDGAGPGDPSNPASPCGSDQLCLDRARYDQPFIWIARTGENRVQRINTTTFETDLYVPTHTVQSPGDTTCTSADEPCLGWSPSRTAVALDGSVWVGFRGCRTQLSNCGNSHLPQHGNATRIATDGTVICRADVTSGASGQIAVRSVTLDHMDNAWIGSWNERKIYQFSGSEVEEHEDGVPRCKLLREVDLIWEGQRSRAYGAAVSSEGDLWIATLGNGRALKVDTTSGQVVAGVNLPYQSYGLAIDQRDNVWFGIWNSNTGGVMKIDATTNDVTHIPGPSDVCTTSRTRGVAVDFAGNMWVAAWDCNRVIKYSPAGDVLGAFPVDGQPLGMAVANDGRIWSVNYGNSTATVLEPDGTPVDTGNRLRQMGGPYTYSDMTGLQHRIVTRQQGTWINTWDSSWLDARWIKVTWTAVSMPVGTSVCVRVRAANTRAELATRPYTEYHCSEDLNAEVDLIGTIGGDTPEGRYIQVEVRLTGAHDESPVVEDLEVHWERP